MESNSVIDLDISTSLCFLFRLKSRRSVDFTFGRETVWSGKIRPKSLLFYDFGRIFNVIVFYKFVSYESERNTSLTSFISHLPL